MDMYLTYINWHADTKPHARELDFTITTDFNSLNSKPISHKNCFVINKEN